MTLELKPGVWPREHALALYLAGRSNKVEAVLAEELDPSLSERDQAFVRALVFSAFRKLPAVTEILDERLTADTRLEHRALLELALAERMSLSTPRHALVASWVDVAREKFGPAIAGMVNAVLRRTEQQSSNAELPQHFIDALRAAWPEQAEPALEAFAMRAPQWLRLTRAQDEGPEVCAQLRSEEADLLTDPDIPDAIRVAPPRKSQTIPGYDEGWFSVMDINAQRAVELLEPPAGALVLDACAAPGNKTMAIADRWPEIARIDAFDYSFDRLERLRAEQQRLRPRVPIKSYVGDLTTKHARLESAYDVILLDPPCSALGVVRRHPDRLARQFGASYRTLEYTQLKLLDTCIKRLKPGGRLLYVTCTFRREENDLQVKKALARHRGLTVVELPEHAGIAADPGRMLLPTDADSGDAFYYALLTREG